MFEDLAIVLAAFTATTAVGVAYALSKTLRTVREAEEKPVKRVVVLNVSDLPAQVDTRFSKLVLEADEKIRDVEARAERLLKEIMCDLDGS